MAEKVHWKGYLVHEFAVHWIALLSCCKDGRQKWPNVDFEAEKGGIFRTRCSLCRLYPFLVYLKKWLMVSTQINAFVQLPSTTLIHVPICCLFHGLSFLYCYFVTGAKCSLWIVSPQLISKIVPESRIQIISSQVNIHFEATLVWYRGQVHKNLN